jgi:hypothetical protein
MADTKQEDQKGANEQERLNWSGEDHAGRTKVAVKEKPKEEANAASAHEDETEVGSKRQVVLFVAGLIIGALITSVLI